MFTLNRATTRMFVYVFLMLLISNLGAMVDRVLHSEIPYFDEEHLVVGGVTAIVMILLLGTLEVYLAQRRRVEAALRESEERFALLFNEAPLGYQALDEEGRFLDVNAAWLEALGYVREEVLGRWFGDFLAPEYVEAFQERFEAFKERGAIHSAFELINKNGERRVIDFEGRIGHKPDGAFAQTHCILTDITERRLAEEELRRSTALLSRGESLAHLGSWERDVASGVTTVSAEWQRQHGLSGEHVTDEEVLSICHPDDREALTSAIDGAAAGEPQRLAHRIVRSDMREVRHLMTFGEPRFDARGRVEAVMGASLDVTGRVRADAVLLEREERLQRALADTVAALGATVSMRDPYTSAHERRVAELVCKIAERLNWSVEAIERLRIAALVHDVGKISVPAEILSKPSCLTELEFELIKAHSAAACEILAPIDFGGPVAEIILQHHERLDGSGYPQGLSGERVLPGARLLAVADVVEAMTTHRPYRPALPLEEALAEIEGGAGTRYDAAACEVAAQLFREEGFTFSE